MRVVVPKAGVYHPDVYAALASHPYEIVDVSGSDRAYFDLLAKLWAAGDTVAVVEHDIVVGPSTLDKLAACPHDWCSFPYRYGSGVAYGLGCVKFSAALMARIPDAVIRIGVMSDMTHPRRHWCRLDAWLQGIVLPNAGEVLHRHTAEVVHLGHGAAHGCTPTF